MSVVRAACRQCGDILLDARTITIAYPYYTFTCPHCEQPHIKDAKPDLVVVLACAGSPTVPVIDDAFYQATVEAELGVAS